MRHMTSSRRWVVSSLLAAVVLAACSSASKSSHPPVTTTTTTTTTRSSYPTSTVVTSGATTTSTAPAADDASWTGLRLTITQQTLGHVRVGMTIAQAEAAAGVAFDGMADGAAYPTTLPAGYPHLFVDELPNGTVSCVGAEIGAAQHSPQTVATPDGLRLGDTVHQLVAIYGSRARYVPKPSGGISPHAGYVVTEPDGNLAISVFGSTVVGIKGGAHDLTPSGCTG